MIFPSKHCIIITLTHEFFLFSMQGNNDDRILSCCLHYCKDNARDYMPRNSGQLSSPLSVTIICILQITICILQITVCLLQITICLLLIIICLLQITICLLQITVCLLQITLSCYSEMLFC